MRRPVWRRLHAGRGAPTDGNDRTGNSQCQCLIGHLGAEIASFWRFPVEQDFDSVEDFRLDAAILEAVDLLDARRARHVDLGQEASDDVDSDEEEAVATQGRAQCIDDPPVVGIEFGPLWPPPDVEI